MTGGAVSRQTGSSTGGRLGLRFVGKAEMEVQRQNFARGWQGIKIFPTG